MSVDLSKDFQIIEGLFFDQSKGVAVAAKDLMSKKDFKISESLKPRLSSPSKPSSGSASPSNRKPAKSPYLATPVDLREFYHPDGRRPDGLGATNQLPAPVGEYSLSWPSAQERQGYELTSAYEGLHSTWKERDQTLVELQSMISEIQTDLPANRWKTAKTQIAQDSRPSYGGGSFRSASDRGGGGGGGNKGGGTDWDSSTKVARATKPHGPDSAPPKLRSKSTPHVKASLSSNSGGRKGGKSSHKAIDPLSSLDSMLPSFSPAIPDPTNHLFSSNMFGAMGGGVNVDMPSSLERLPLLSAAHLASAEDHRTQYMYSTVNRMLDKTNIGSQDLHNFVSNLESSVGTIDVSDSKSSTSSVQPTFPSAAAASFYYQQQQALQLQMQIQMQQQQQMAQMQPVQMVMVPYGYAPSQPMVMYPATTGMVYQQPQPQPQPQSPYSSGTHSPASIRDSARSYSSSVYSSSTNPYLNSTYRDERSSSVGSEALPSPSSASTAGAAPAPPHQLQTYLYPQLPGYPPTMQLHLGGGGYMSPSGGGHPYQNSYAGGVYYSTGPAPQGYENAYYQNYGQPPTLEHSASAPALVEHTHQQQQLQLQNQTQPVQSGPTAAQEPPTVQPGAYATPPRPSHAPEQPSPPELSQESQPASPPVQPDAPMGQKLGLNTNTGKAPADAPPLAKDRSLAQRKAEDLEPERRSVKLPEKPKQQQWEEETVKALFSKIRHNKVKELEEILDTTGVPLDIRDSFGNTPLCVACQNGHKSIIKALLRRNADLNLVNHKGHTALHFCFAYGYSDLGEYLISKGADDTIRNTYGMTCYEGLGPRT